MKQCENHCSVWEKKLERQIWKDGSIRNQKIWIAAKINRENLAGLQPFAVAIGEARRSKTKKRKKEGTEILWI